MAGSATITGFETRGDKSNRHTVFELQVSLPSESSDPPKPVKVYKRYSEFRDLFDQVKELLPSDVKPKFPSKRLLNNFDREFLEGRKRGLQDFMSQLMSIPEVAGHATIKAWVAGKARRGHSRHTSDELFDVDLDDASPERVDSSDASDTDRFDLGPTEDQKATIDDFTLLKVIGKGSFGKVLLARHNAQQVVFAIKVLNKEAIIRQNEVRHIKSERNVLIQNFKHPFLVGLHFSFQTRSKLYFVLDYVNGGELFYHLQREKKFSIQRSQFYSAELTSALGYLHSLDVVYRDLKPENILLTHDGHVILTDFGLCKENVRPGETTGTFCGTPEYLAPEVLKKHTYGRPVDWWCLGCVTYEMMCGLPPFYSRDCTEMYDRILHEKLRFPDHVPPLARSWLEAILHRQPDRRLGGGPADAEEVRSHPFFGNVDWIALEKKELRPPWSPNVAGPLDLRHIDPDFIKEPIPQSVATGTPGFGDARGTPVAASSIDTPFDGFTYTGGDGPL
eukprot:m.180984 g.180984  ORF g.180984 m.180984 type:complete len:505 (+) comp18025_c0_seq6:558-2072(+)